MEVQEFGGEKRGDGVYERQVGEGAGEKCQAHGVRESGENEEIGKDRNQGDCTKIIKGDWQGHESGGNGCDDGAGDKTGAAVAVEKASQARAQNHNTEETGERKQPAEVDDVIWIQEESGRCNKKDEAPGSDFSADEPSKEGKNRHDAGTENRRSETDQGHEEQNKKNGEK